MKLTLNIIRDLWETHNDYPLAPERLEIDNTEKLVGNFLPKSHYVLFTEEYHFRGALAREAPLRSTMGK